MTSEPENIVLKQLAAVRVDIQEGFAKLTAEQVATNEKLGSVASSLVGMQRDIRDVKRELATLGVAVDEHTHRLDKIEKHLGLNTERH